MDISVIIEGQPMMQAITKKDGTTTNKYFFVGKTTNDRFPRTVAFTCLGDETWQRLAIIPGHQYVLSIDISSHEYNGRWYTEVNVWKSVDVSQQQPQQPSAQPTQAAPSPLPY